MNSSGPSPAGPSGLSRELTLAILRLILGMVFLYMGFSKALHPVDFLKLVRQYDWIQAPWILNGVAAGLPWFEIFCGALLVGGIGVRGAALLIILMLVPFTLAVWHRAAVLQSGLHIPFCAVKFDCGCGSGEIPACRKLLENTLLLAAAFAVVIFPPTRFCLRACLFRRPAAFERGIADSQ
ncbi:MAG: DoxX family protein [Verrucomicrobiota bacterium]